MYEYQNLLPTIFDQIAENLFSPHYCRPVLLGILSEDACFPDNHKTRDSLYFLHPVEKETFHGYKLAKRRTEYLTGRVCAKLAIQNHHTSSRQIITQLEPEQIAVLPGANGRPTITPKDNRLLPALEISISHSRNYAVAAVSRQHCGIDIQYSSETLLRVREKYCTPKEDRLLQLELPDQKQLSRLAILWAAKEAIQKNTIHKKMPGFLDIELKELVDRSTDNIGFHLVMQINNSPSAHHIYHVAATFFNGYSIALTIKGNSQNA